MKHYTIEPNGNVWEVQRELRQFRKTPRGWIHDPHEEDWKRHGIVRMRSPFVDKAEDLLEVLRSALSERGQLIPWEDVA